MAASAAAQLADTCRSARFAVDNMRVLRDAVRQECDRATELIAKSEEAINGAPLPEVRPACQERRAFIIMLSEIAEQSAHLSGRLSAATAQKDEAEFSKALEACVVSRKAYLSKWREYETHRRNCGC